MAEVDVAQVRPAWPDTNNWIAPHIAPLLYIRVRCNPGAKLSKLIVLVENFRTQKNVSQNQGAQYQ